MASRPHQQAGQDEIWRFAIEQLESRLDSLTFSTCVQPLTVRPGGADGVFCLLAPNGFVKRRVEESCLGAIRDEVENYIGGELTLLIEVETQSPTPAEASPGSTARKAPSLVIGETIDPVYSFATHVEGRSNKLARAAAMAVAESPGKVYNPLFLYGGTGLGKTHLMQAAGNVMKQLNPDLDIIYIQAERFVHGFVNATRNGTIDQYTSRFRQASALLMDDVQFLGSRNTPGSQEELFHTLNQFLSAKKQIILASDRQPIELQRVDDRLVSRFNFGLNVAIEAPDHETRLAILQNKAESQGVTLGDDVANFVASCSRSNVRELEGSLNKVIAVSRLYGKDIDVGLAREALADLVRFRETRVSVENIQKTVAEYYKIRLSEMMSRRRDRKVARPRQIAMALSKELTSRSLPDIGESFGGRDHTTVLHACRKIDELCKSDASIAEDIENLRRLLT